MNPSNIARGLSIARTVSHAPGSGNANESLDDRLAALYSLSLAAESADVTGGNNPASLASLASSHKRAAYREAKRELKRTRQAQRAAKWFERLAWTVAVLPVAYGASGVLGTVVGWVF